MFTQAAPKRLAAGTVAGSAGCTRPLLVVIVLFFDASRLRFALKTPQQVANPPY
jgi:hypothetical protein